MQPILRKSVQCFLSLWNRCSVISVVFVLPHLTASDKSTIRIIADLPHNHPTSGDFITEERTQTSPHLQMVHNHTECEVAPSATAATIATWIVLVSIALGTAGGNFLVILAVTLVKKLQTPSNFLIVSLAFSDFLVGILVLPFAILHVVRGSWPFNEALCDMYISFDVLMCTASILNLCAISIDRYLVITRPLTYVARRTPCRMGQMIAAAWIISALISIPPNFGWKPPYVKCKCEYSKDVGYQIYATFCAFYLPLFVMIVLYGKIFKLAREMSRIEQLQLTPSSPEGTTHEKLESANEEMIKKQEISKHVNVCFENVQQIKSDKNQVCAMVSTQLRNQRNLINGNRSPGNSVLCSSRTTSTAFTRSSSSNVPKRRSRNQPDTKVIRTLGVIMGCFCLCWLPFFIMQLLLALLKASGDDREDMVPPVVFRFLLWLGYINSLLNPLIYAKFNREFRLPFKLILLCKCRNINARLRSEAFSAEYGLPAGGSSSRRTSPAVHSNSTRVDRRSLLDSTRTSVRTSANNNIQRQPN